METEKDTEHELEQELNCHVLADRVLLEDVVIASQLAFPSGVVRVLFKDNSIANIPGKSKTTIKTRESYFLQVYHFTSARVLPSPCACFLIIPQK